MRTSSGLTITRRLKECTTGFNTTSTGLMDPSGVTHTVVKSMTDHTRSDVSYLLNTPVNSLLFTPVKSLLDFIGHGTLFLNTPVKFLLDFIVGPLLLIQTIFLSKQTGSPPLTGGLFVCVITLLLCLLLLTHVLTRVAWLPSHFALWMKQNAWLLSTLPAVYVLTLFNN